MINIKILSQKTISNILNYFASLIRTHSDSINFRKSPSRLVERAPKKQTADAWQKKAKDLWFQKTERVILKRKTCQKQVAACVFKVTVGLELGRAGIRSRKWVNSLNRSRNWSEKSYKRIFNDSENKKTQILWKFKKVQLKHEL